MTKRHSLRRVSRENRLRLGSVNRSVFPERCRQIAGKKIPGGSGDDRAGEAVSAGEPIACSAQGVEAESAGESAHGIRPAESNEVHFRAKNSETPQVIDKKR